MAYFGAYIAISRVADPVLGAGSSKSEFFNPDPDPTGAYQESIQTSKFFSHQTYFF